MSSCGICLPAATLWISAAVLAMRRCSLNRWVIRFSQSTDAKSSANIHINALDVLFVANALKNSKTDWSKISSKTVKDVLTGDERFVSITFDENDQIVCTDSNADLIIDIIREVYSKQLFTEEIIETKGV